ncbi:hypothetical protein F5Y15DRAFT_87414 [Xylariaceae sp. FL0016]|nr:hypothetical protein F5Y15DRAFT_87414 [Xylariaceae sp. FL0016]
MGVEVDALPGQLDPFASWPGSVGHLQNLAAGTRGRCQCRCNQYIAPRLPNYFITRKADPSSREGSGEIGSRPADVLGRSELWSRSPIDDLRRDEEADFETDTVALYLDIEGRESVVDGTSTVSTPLANMGEDSVDSSLPDMDSRAAAIHLTDATKRKRPSHDVDGPGTGILPCKKRRIRHHLITSRLSKPYSLPATHIPNRENDDDDTPVLTRFLKAAVLGAKKAGHQTALVRKAAILNRVRLGVRQAALSRGHTFIIDMAARGNVLNHGLQLVTVPATSTGALFPERPPTDHSQMPPFWRPHTTMFNSAGGKVAAPIEQPPRGGGDFVNAPREKIENPEAKLPSRTPPPRPPDAYPQAETDPGGLVDEDDGMSFPSSHSVSRYADLSDDDMDDVYADFGVLFGGGSRSPEARASGSNDEDHFYEEYLDELDGIPWLT